MSTLRINANLLVVAAMLALVPIANAQTKREHSKAPKPSGPSRSREHSDRGTRDKSSDDTRRDSRTSDRRSDDSGRYNPFSRSTNRNDRGGSEGGPSPAARGRTILGTPVREQRAFNYDGRGNAQPQRFGSAPTRDALSLSIAGGSGIGTSIAVGAKIGNLRVGFVSYSNPAPRPGIVRYGNDFAYPYYVYDPYAPGAVVVASPWYGYSFLPPYMDGSRVIVETGYPAWGWNGWTVLDLNAPRVNPAARTAVNDLQDAFEGESGRLADKLVPESGDVAIFNDGKYDYSLNPDDFQKMFLDGVEQSKTVSYQILEARYRGDEVRIRAKHTFTDSWGETQSDIHRITLRRENDGDYVIREFGTE